MSRFLAVAAQAIKRIGCGGFHLGAEPGRVDH